GADAEAIELVEDPVEPARDLLVAERLGSGSPREERDAAAGLEHGALDLVERREALLVRRRLELGQRDELPPEAIGTDPAVLDQHVGLALDEPVEPLVAVEEPDDQIVDDEERRRADDATRHRVVIAD